MPNGGGLTYDSARHMAIKAVIESHEGRAAMEQAVASGQPAVCGVDALLTSIIKEYNNDESLRHAGRVVAECMRALKRNQGPLKSCPAGCTVKEGTMWLP